jgi:hypothetical protein
MTAAGYLKIFEIVASRFYTKNKKLLFSVTVAAVLVVLSTFLVAIGFQILDLGYHIRTIAIANVLFYLSCGAVILAIKEFNCNLKRVFTLFLISLLFLSSISTAFFYKLATMETDTRARLAWGSPEVCVQKALDECNTGIDSSIRYIMDGCVDEWAYALFNKGIANIPYEKIAVTEQGQLYLYSFVLKLFNVFNLYPLIVINAMSNLITALLLYILCRHYINSQTAIFAAIGVLFLPEGILWAGVLHKDSLVLLLIMLLVFSYIKIFKEKRYPYYIFPSQWHCFGYAIDRISCFFMDWEKSVGEYFIHWNHCFCCFDIFSVIPKSSGSGYFQQSYFQTY